MLQPPIAVQLVSEFKLGEPVVAVQALYQKHFRLEFSVQHLCTQQQRYSALGFVWYDT